MLTAVSVYFIGQTVGNIERLVMVVFMTGVLMNTSQASMPALAAGFYPTEGRATGVAWMLGIGRFGGIVGSFLVAEPYSPEFLIRGIFCSPGDRGHWILRGFNRSAVVKPGSTGRTRRSNGAVTGYKPDRRFPTPIQ
jgi:hypothetical protein